LSKHVKGIRLWFSDCWIRTQYAHLNERGVGLHSLQENLTMEKSNATGQ